MGDKVKIRLSPDTRLAANTTLTFAPPGSIRSAYGNPLTAPSAAGDFTITQPKAQVIGHHHYQQQQYYLHHHQHHHHHS